MKKVKLYIAMSLDGFIADKDGGVNFLRGHGEEEENEGSYSDFIKGIDTVLMGWNTYNQIVTELSQDKWVYDGLDVYVFTHREIDDTGNIHFTCNNFVQTVQKLKSNCGKDIWICGGASLAQQSISAGIVDEYYISVIPVILGDGIRLFGKTDKEIKLKLIKTSVNNGITELHYVKR